MILKIIPALTILTVTSVLSAQEPPKDAPHISPVLDSKPLRVGEVRQIKWYIETGTEITDIQITKYPSAENGHLSKAKESKKLIFSPVKGAAMNRALLFSNEVRSTAPGKIEIKPVKAVIWVKSGEYKKSWNISTAPLFLEVL